MKNIVEMAKKRPIEFAFILSFHAIIVYLFITAIIVLIEFMYQFV